MYWLQLMDKYAANWSVLLIAICECGLIAWLYGSENFLDDIQGMIGQQSTCWVTFWSWMWRIITPAALLVSAFRSRITFLIFQRNGNQIFRIIYRRSSFYFSTGSNINRPPTVTTCIRYGPIPLVGSSDCYQLPSSLLRQSFKYARRPLINRPAKKSNIY